MRPSVDNPGGRALLALAAAGLLAGCAIPPPPELRGLDRGDLRRAVDLAAEYLYNACGDDGRFAYSVNTDPNVPPSGRYSMVRHAGAVYVLADYARRHNRPDMLPALLRAAEFLKGEIAPLPARPDVLALWSRPEPGNVKRAIRAKLGGAALSLAALINIERLRPGYTPRRYLRRIGEFILYMQRSDGSFSSRYIPAEDGRDNYWTSLYYPGEAVVGLMMLYELDRQPRWLQAAANAMGYLAVSRARQRTVPVDHWALLGTARLLPHYRRCRPPVPAEAVIDHAARLCRAILAGAPASAAPGLGGCLVAGAATCPTAIRCEGMLAALEFLPAGYAQLRTRIARQLAESVDFLIRSQIKAGPYAGGITRVARPTGGGPSAPTDHARPGRRARARPDPRATQIRIDFVQHALSAMMQYEKLCGWGP